jgi:hypothetical protein
VPPGAVNGPHPGITFRISYGDGTSLTTNAGGQTIKLDHLHKATGLAFPAESLKRRKPDGSVTTRTVPYGVAIKRWWPLMACTGVEVNLASRGDA